MRSRMCLWQSAVLLVGIVGCGPFSKKPLREGPPPLTVPGEKKRAQKPEPPPPIIALPPPNLADGQVAVRAVAYVNNVPIFDSELREAMVFRMRDLGQLSDTEREAKVKEIRAAELDKLVDREVVLAAAMERLKKMPAKIMDDLQREAGKEFDRKIKMLRDEYKITSDEQLKSFLAQQGMSLNNFRRSVERSFISMEFMRNVIFPKLQTIPPFEVQAYYDAHPEEFTQKERVKWLDIFLDASKFADRGAAMQYAQEITKHLQAGSDFLGAAKRLRDAGYNIALGDNGIGEKRGDIRPTELENAVFAIPTGQVGAPIELGGGIHIIKVVEKEQAGKKPLTPELQREIREKLQNLLSAKEYRRLVEEMRSKALIQKLE